LNLGQYGWSAQRKFPDAAFPRAEMPADHRY